MIKTICRCFQCVNCSARFCTVECYIYIAACLGSDRLQLCTKFCFLHDVDQRTDILECVSFFYRRGQ